MGEIQLMSVFAFRRTVTSLKHQHRSLLYRRNMSSQPTYISSDDLATLLCNKTLRPGYFVKQIKFLALFTCWFSLTFTPPSRIDYQVIDVRDDDFIVRMR